MQTLIAFASCVLIIAMGDILSIITKAKIPTMTGIIILYLIAVALGMPRSYPEVSGLAPLGNLMFSLFVAALTTNILPLDFIKKWKFILIGCIAVLFSMLFVILAGGIFLDYKTLFTGAMVVSGGAFTGSVLVVEHLKGSGMTELVTLALLLATTIDAIGQPIGSLVMQKYVKRLIAADAYKKQKQELPNTSVSDRYTFKWNRHRHPYNSPENPSPWFAAWIPPKYETKIVALFQLSAATFLAYWLGDLTGLGWAFMLIIIGLAGSFLGFFRMDMLKRTHSSGIIMCAIFGMVFDMLNDLTLVSVISQIVPFILVILLSCTGLILGGFLGARIFGYDPWMGAACTIGLFYFFPGIQNIINEVVRSHARNLEERNYIMEQISSPALITAFMGSRFFLFIGTLLMPIIL